MALKIRDIPVEGYERVVEGIDKDLDLHALIAVHNSRLGPALGGTRMYPYRTTEAALTDVLRLSKGMTYKSALAEIGLGGGKSVIIGDPKTQKNPDLLLGFAKLVDSLAGLYICAEDMGTTPQDMRSIRQGTKWVSALPGDDSSGDPSPYTAWGVFRGMQAVAETLWGTKSMRGKTVAIQGLGNVGKHLCHYLYWHGASILVADISLSPVQDMCKKYGAKGVSTDDILFSPCDILAPCAIGGILSDQTIPQLNCKAIAGAANNQLLREEDGCLLRDRDILYAPDYVINAGGIINVAVELEPEGYDPAVARDKVGDIFGVIKSIFEIAHRDNISTSLAADRLAEYKLENQIGKREKEVCIHH